MRSFVEVRVPHPKHVGLVESPQTEDPRRPRDACFARHREISRNVLSSLAVQPERIEVVKQADGVPRDGDALRQLKLTVPHQDPPWFRHIHGAARTQPARSMKMIGDETTPRAIDEDDWLRDNAHPRDR